MGDRSVSRRRIHIGGSGSYRVSGEFAVTHEMRLWLRVDGADPALYDSGLDPGGGGFPRIDIRVSHDENACVTTVLDLHAQPSRPFTTRPPLGQLVPIEILP